MDTEERIGVLCAIDVQVGADKVLRWCQGKVKSRLNAEMLWGKEIPTVMVDWDAIPDVGGWEDRRLGPTELKERLFNRDKEGAWRLDVALAPIWDKEDDKEESGSKDDKSDDESIFDDNKSDNDNDSELSPSSDSEMNNSDKSNDESDDE